MPCTIADAMAAAADVSARGFTFVSRSAGECVMSFQELAQAASRQAAAGWDLGLAVGQVLVVRPGVLPKTRSGKVQRAKTRALFLDGTLHRTARGQKRRTPQPAAADGAAALAGRPGMSAVPPAHGPPRRQASLRGAAMTGYDHISSVRELAEQVTERPLGEISPDTRIADLGVDSVTFAEIVVRIEDALGIEIAFPAG